MSDRIGGSLKPHFDLLVFWMTAARLANSERQLRANRHRCNQCKVKDFERFGTAQSKKTSAKVEHYLLSGPDSPFWDGARNTVTAWCEVIEFQEGTRRTGPNAISMAPNRDGTGAEHRHILVWAAAARRSNIASHVRADCPPDQPDLAELVRRVQCSHKGSRIALRDEPSAWVLIQDNAGARWSVFDRFIWL